MRAVASKCSIAILLGLGFATLGCQQESSQFLQVQFCIPADQRLTLIELLQDVAREGDMTLFDGSSELDAVAEHQRAVTGNPLARLDSKISISLIGGGTTISVVNVGLPDQMVAGFRSDDLTDETRVFAREVVARLERLWTVHVVPDGQGAIPIDCSISG